MSDRSIPFPGLKDKLIWIIGGAGYLGTPITIALDRSCGKSVCVDLLDKAQKLVEQKGLAKTHAETCDLSQLDKLGTFINSLFLKHGVPDGVINLAFASSSGKTLDALDSDDFAHTMNGGLCSSFLLGRAVADRMKDEKGGSVVLISSMYGMVSPDPMMYAAPMTPNPIDYGVSKAGILQMMRYFAVHYGASGVRFNCITPGAFTNLQTQASNPDFVERQCAKIPLHRVGIAEEMVGPALFLLSDISSYVTGHSLVVDGGWTAW